MPYSYDEETIREVRDRNDIVEVISQYVELKRAGSNYKGLCPFHNEKTPSMVVSPEKQMFRCFGCGEGGDVISFLSKYRNMDFKEVIVELAERANVELKQKTDEDREKERKRNLLYEINREAAIFFYRNLPRSQKAMEYLKRRGIEKHTIKRFGLGYVEDSWSTLLDYLKRKGYREDDIETAGLAIKHREKKSYYDRFRGRIIYPIWDVNSRVIGFGGRLLEELENQPKYLNSPDTPIFTKGRNLYGLNLIKNTIRGGRVVLVEGYMDVISLYQNGVENSTASLGTALTKEQVKLLKRYTEDIVIAYDSDDAGVNAAKKAAEILKSEDIVPKVVEIEKGLDPDDYIKKYGSERFKLKVEGAVHYIDFILNINKQKYDLELLEDKLKFINDMSYWLKTIKSPVELELYTAKTADEIGVSVDTVRGEIEKKRRYSFKTATGNRPSYEKASLPKSDTVQNSERQMEMELLNLILIRKSNVGDIGQKISYIDFQDDINRVIAMEMLETGEKETADGATQFGDRTEIEKRMQEIESLELFLEKGQEKKALDDYARKLKIRSLKKRKKDILGKLGKLENGSEENSSGEDFKALCRELTDIDRDIKRY